MWTCASALEGRGIHDPSHTSGLARASETLLFSLEQGPSFQALLGCLAPHTLGCVEGKDL